MLAGCISITSVPAAATRLAIVLLRWALTKSLVSLLFFPGLNVVVTEAPRDLTPLMYSFDSGNIMKAMAIPPWAAATTSPVVNRLPGPAIVAPVAGWNPELVSAYISSDTRPP